MPLLDGRVCVITGANQGIGKAIAEVFAAEGAKLALCARNMEKLGKVEKELTQRGGDVLAVSTDVSNDAAVENFFRLIKERFGRVDVLINNAGNFDGGRLDQVTTEGWNNVIGACLTGAFLCSRSAFALMKEQGGGRIINIGSISARRSREECAPYTAAKFGVRGLTEATALDGRPFGIVCSCLHPGNVRVERRVETGLNSDDEPMMEMETIAKVALTMATLPPEVNMLEAIVLPNEQLYIGRG
jgi:NAD(P)-dependent dehydrogenase (short-subunit alcohol dehydrogenase family)